LIVLVTVMDPLWKILATYVEEMVQHVQLPVSVQMG
jgi:hypothetical protein